MMVATTPVPSLAPDSEPASGPQERRVVTTVLAFSGAGAGLALTIRLAFGGASAFDLVALSGLTILLLACAAAVKAAWLPTVRLYRAMTLLVVGYILVDLSAGLLMAADPAGSEAALRTLPTAVPFAYLFAFLGWRAQRALALSGSLLLCVGALTTLLIVSGVAPTPSLEVTVDFGLEFAVANVLLIGLLVLFARARGEISQAQRALAAMGLLARTDVLTGVLNRRGFREQLEREAERSVGRACRMSFVLIDVDHFKRINDRYGHPAGDQVLMELGHLLTRLIRTSDELGRWGGEEFVILMRRAAPGEALFLADRLRRAIDEHTFPGIGSLTASFGVAELGVEDTLEELILQADEALYRAKTSGRNRTCVSREMMEAMSGGDRQASIIGKA